MSQDLKLDLANPDRFAHFWDCSYLSNQKKGCHRVSPLFMDHGH